LEVLFFLFCGLFYKIGQPASCFSQRSENCPQNLSDVSCHGKSDGQYELAWRKEIYDCSYQRAKRRKYAQLTVLNGHGKPEYQRRGKDPVQEIYHRQNDTCLCICPNQPDNIIYESESRSQYGRQHEFYGLTGK